ncbi:MAG: hypothetical protein KZQ95_01360 [Candidatus Thiodiazotropha sp. (ex Epidulcina cf. delphinae)]|nr:hypothetical protein [Candidatus Thiodiazotropha sp. (ex Epidulcina cf. delphinae)]
MKHVTENASWRLNQQQDAKNEKCNPQITTNNPEFKGDKVELDSARPETHTF